MGWQKKILSGSIHDGMNVAYQYPKNRQRASMTAGETGAGETVLVIEATLVP